MLYKNSKLVLSFWMLLFGAATLAQTSEINGVIADDLGPLIGATIIDETSGLGTITDSDGSFALNVELPTNIRISYIGYEDKVVRVESIDFLDVSMSESSQFLDEVVVVAYGNKKRSEIAGAVGTITADEIKEAPVLRIEQAIQGRTAGVHVSQNSGSPGSRLAVRIRGLGTLQNSDPLYVVDGIIVDGIDFLNPEDVQSISILKDAASAAAYGARAANGVVLITTTSKSFKDQSSISYNAYYGMQSLLQQVELLNGREYAAIWNESYINSGRAPLYNLTDLSIFNQGTNWQSALFENAPMMNHQLRFEGSKDKWSYAASGSYFIQDGIIGGRKSGFDRRTVRLVSDYQSKPWLNIGFNIGLTNLSRNGLLENSEFVSPTIFALNMDPLTPVYKPDGTFAYSDFVDTDIRNPLGAIEYTNDIWKSNRVVGGTNANLDLTKNIYLRSNFGIDMTFANQRTFNPSYDLSYLENDAPAQEVNDVNGVGFNNNNWRLWQWENFIGYRDTFGIHTINGIVGTSAIEGSHYFNGGGNTNLPPNIFEFSYVNNTIDPINSQNAFEGISEYAYLSYLTKWDYGLMDRYFVEASYRRDGSSKFGPNYRFGNFFAGSLAWVLSREAFFNIDFVSLLKLRASWGQNGNDRIGDYAFTSVVLGGQNYTFGADEVITNGSIAPTLSNPDLRWESVTQTDLGIDAELWEGRLNISADYFIKNTDDMLYLAPILTVAGAAAPFQNIGKVQNKGFEFSAATQGGIGPIDYDLGANVSFLSNEVIDLGGGDPTISGNTFVSGAVSRTDIGYPIASFYGYLTDGIFQSQDEVNAHSFQNENTAPGDIRFKDLNNDGVVDEDDQTFIGNPTPDIIYGANFGLNFLNFDLSGFFAGAHGNDIFNASVRYDKIGANRHASILDRWTGPGTSDAEPRVGITDPNNNARSSDRFIEDGSFLKLKNIQIGYDISPFLERLKVSKCRIYFSVQNAYTWTKYSGFDPELGLSSPLIDGNPNPLDIGIDRGFYPASRIFLGGLNLKF